MSSYKTITPPKGSLRSPITLTIVAHLQANGPTRLVDIDLALSKVDGWSSQTDPAKLLRVLNKLRESKHVHRVLRDDEMLWAPGPHPQDVDQDAERIASTQAYCPPVLPPQYDRMHGPLYVPDAGPALRSGAMDFKRLPTVGLRCARSNTVAPP